MSKGMRPQRVAEMIRQEIGALLMQGMKDPRIGFVSVMRVKMSVDLRYADVYVSLYGAEPDRKSSLVALRNASGWVRRELGQRIRMRYTPEVRFFPDDTLDTVYHLENVFERLHEEEKAAPFRRLTLAETLDELHGAGSFLITCHDNPDGDAVGSVLALRLLLHALGKRQITVACADPPPEVYRFLPGAEKWLGVADACEDVYDRAILLDACEFERAGTAAPLLARGRHVLVLDHHLGEGPQGAMGVIDAEFAATGEIIAELFQVAQQPVNHDAATCIYVAQATDTGGYRYSNTNARSHAIAGRMHETGIDTAAICRRVFNRMAPAKFALLQRVLNRTRFAAGGRLAHSYITMDDMEETQARKEDHNNLVNVARDVDGVVVGVLFTETGPGETKVSMRTNDDFDAAAFLQQFGGGGHAAAAGLTLDKPLADAENMIVEALLAVLTGEEE